MDVDVRITEQDIAQWLGEFVLTVKRQAKAIEILNAKLDEFEKKVEKE